MTAKKTPREFILLARARHGNLYDYSNTTYTDYITKVTITCRKHGDFEQLPGTHLNGSGCQACRIEAVKRSITKTTIEFVQRAQVIHGNECDYSKVDYVRATDKVIITCLKDRNHGDFEQTPNQHLQGQGCPKCGKGFQKSKIASKWLSVIGVPDDEQHREVPAVVFGRRLVFDGFNPETRTVFEFYGDVYHGNPSIFGAEEESFLGGKTFGQLNEERIARENLILRAGYELVTVWESDFRAQEKKKSIEKRLNVEL